ncbi:MAG: flavin reductase family protein [Candidatus Woesearchaeota archaeon]|jgi:flavin reductase (DIM6/NTAB) family NADH-FMN oxidoreductase RutF|nr:flavin reductase family protein [Candidatus Woesearchaeota archaeon]|tara:strand:+ start:1420 stop:1929 length:510 start_codon:yes stop_codon:yes gene_type:complete
MPSIYNPRQTVLVTCSEVIENKFTGREEEKDNIITVDWHTPLSFKPFFYAIAIGKTRFSHKLIKESMVFVVNFMPFHLKKEVLYCGRHTGEHLDKFEGSGLTKEEADKIHCCKIKEALAHIECEVVNSIDISDHTLFIGKVVYSEEKDDEGRRIFHTEGDNFVTTNHQI